MSANIWNTYEMVGAAVTGVLTGGVPAIAFMILKQRDGSRELAAANTAWSNALKVQDANDRARWAPAYSGNLFAIEAEKPHEAEVLHVEYPTGELPVLADQPADEDEVGDEQPSEAWFDRLKDAFDDAARGVAEAINWPVALVRHAYAGWRRWRDERYLIGSGEQAVDPAQPLREVLAASGYTLDPDDEALVELEAWRAANPPSNPQPYRGRHWQKDVEHTGAWPIVNVPAQRDGGDDL